MTAAETTPRGGSGEMFDRIAGHYDRLNRTLSFGLDRGWRRRTVDALGIEGGERVLDLATGTADLAIEIAGRHPEVAVVGLDPSEGMLEIGRQKVAKAGFNGRIELLRGDAGALPFEDRRFERVAIAFGIRNVPARARALEEICRVLAPGGRLAILELAEPDGGPLAVLARLYVHQVVPRIGAFFGSPREYGYLPESIAAFPRPDAFKLELAAAGFERIGSERLSFGAALLFTAERRGGA